MMNRTQRQDRTPRFDYDRRAPTNPPSPNITTRSTCPHQRSGILKFPLFSSGEYTYIRADHGLGAFVSPRRYLQVFVNASVVIFVMYLAVQFVLTVRRDVKDRMREVSVGKSPIAKPNPSSFTFEKSCRRSLNVRICI